MKTFAQPKTITSMLVEPPVIAPAIEVDTSVPMLDLPTMDLPGAPSGGLTAGNISVSFTTVTTLRFIFSGGKQKRIFLLLIFVAA